MSRIYIYIYYTCQKVKIFAHVVSECFMPCSAIIFCRFCLIEAWGRQRDYHDKGPAETGGHVALLKYILCGWLHPSLSDRQTDKQTDRKKIYIYINQQTDIYVYIYIHSAMAHIGEFKRDKSNLGICMDAVGCMLVC